VVFYKRIRRKTEDAGAGHKEEKEKKKRKKKKHKNKEKNKKKKKKKKKVQKRGKTMKDRAEGKVPNLFHTQGRGPGERPSWGGGQKKETTRKQEKRAQGGVGFDD